MITTYDIVAELYEGLPEKNASEKKSGADRYIKERTEDLFELSEDQQEFQKNRAFYGMELVDDSRCHQQEKAQGRPWRQEGWAMKAVSVWA